MKNTHSLPVKWFTEKAEMLQAVTTDYTTETLDVNLCFPWNIQDKGTGSMNAILV